MEPWGKEEDGEKERQYSSWGISASTGVGLFYVLSPGLLQMI